MTMHPRFPIVAQHVAIETQFRRSHCVFWCRCRMVEPTGMRRVASRVALVAALTAIAACGVEGDAGSPPTAGPVATDPSTTLVDIAAQDSALAQTVPPVATNAALGSPDPAMWRVSPDELLTATSESFTALVTRYNCNGGSTGEVLPPTVTLGASEVIVAFTTSSRAPNVTSTCPGNDEVAYLVQLGEPLGARSLLDSACLPGGAAVSGTLCEDGPVRWSLETPP